MQKLAKGCDQLYLWQAEVRGWNVDERKCKRLRFWDESTRAWRYADWGGCTHHYSNILVAGETCRFSANVRLLDFNPNEDIKYRIEKCKILT